LAARAGNPKYHAPAVTWRLLFENIFQIKLWRLVAMDMATADVSFFGQKAYIYSGEYDLMLDAASEGILRNIGLVGVAVVDQPKMPWLVVGGFHAITRALKTRAQNQQAGLAFLFAPVVDAWLLSRLTLTGLWGFHLEDRFRQNGPYAVLLTTFAL
jgi:hypothetical protein